MRVADFLSNVFWVVAVVAMTWTAKAFVALTTFDLVPLPFVGARPYSECLILTLFALLFILAALHLTVHLYRRYATEGERFPGQLFKLQIPRELRWLRVLIFLVCVGVTSVSYTFFVGRMFDHLQIIWHADVGANPVRWDQSVQPARRLGPAIPPEKWPNTRTGWKLLDPAGVLDAGWRWYSWQDSRPAYKRRNDHHPTQSDVSMTAHPGAEPALFSLAALAFFISTVLLCRPLKTRSGSAVEP